MQTIGERLEEARKRRGISLREAAEATKIRGDFLQNLENNKFDVGLPEIYVRGFLRVYATYLKINAEKIVADYHTIVLGKDSPSRSGPRESLGRLDLNQSESAEGAAPAAAESGQEPSSGAHSGAIGRRGLGGNAGDLQKLAILAGAVLSVPLVIWLIWSLASGDPEPKRPTPSANTAAAAPAAPQGTAVLRLRSIANGLYLEVKQESDGQTLFRGTLNKDEQKELPKNGPLKIVANPAQSLRFELNDKPYTLGETKGYASFNLP